MYLEEYRPDNLARFRHVISQSGGGLSIDRYIYNQSGHGIGSFFSKLFKMVVPVARSVAKQTINTGTAILKPHLQDIGKQAVAVGTKLASDKVDELSKTIQTKLDKAREKKFGIKRKPVSRKLISKKRKDLFDQHG